MHQVPNLGLARDERLGAAFDQACAAIRQGDGFAQDLAAPTQFAFEHSDLGVGQQTIDVIGGAEPTDAAADDHDVCSHTKPDCRGAAARVHRRFSQVSITNLLDFVI